MPELSSPIQEPGEGNSIEYSQDIEETLSEEGQQAFFSMLEEMQSASAEAGEIEEETIFTEKANVREMLIEVENSGNSNRFSDPDFELPGERVLPVITESSNFEMLTERELATLSVPEVEQYPLLADLIHEESVASQAVEQKDNPKEKWSKKQKIAVVTSIVAILGLVYGLYVGLKGALNKTESGQMIGNEDNLREDTDYAYTPEAGQTFLSLLMQAASDASYDSLAFTDLGISESTYQNLRAQLLDLRDNVSEDAHWQIMTRQASSIFPSTGKPYTLGDHMLALWIQLNLLEPLYDLQPLDLDLDATISTLAEHIDLTADIPILKLYTNMMEVVPESSGANRLQRLVLARMAIARAITRAQPSA